uniref:Uncharacterized protein n=1 Tax=Rhizophora mucronata TaxID=61149 RepID=A0A2P2IY88_RHIMU
MISLLHSHKFLKNPCLHDVNNYLKHN